MNRLKQVERAYQRGNELNLKNMNYASWLKKFLDEEYREDLGSGDITSEAVLTKDKCGQATIIAKQQGIVGGIEETSWFYTKHGLQVKAKAEDSSAVKKGDIILEVYGKRKETLAIERIGLNILQRASGIATETKRLVDLIEGYDTRVAATRKTLWKYLDKKAVFLGGGLTHRLGLWDSILIKDNHLESLKLEGTKKPVETAIILASRFADKAGFIEIETTNRADAIKAAKKFKQLKMKKPFGIMLDNLESNEIEKIIKTLKNDDLYDYVLLEASGNITGENIREYAESGVDIVSLGYLTHSARILEISSEMTI